MHKIQIFTIAANNYLPKVRALFESIRRHHPDWAINLLLVDVKSADINYDDFLADKVWVFSDLDIPNLRSWMFGHTIVELATAVKPFMAGKLFKATGCKKILYFDPDIVLFSRLDDIVDTLNDFNIILTPHQTIPEAELEAIIDNEVCSLRHGIFNLGFLGLSSSKVTDDFILWWSKRLYHLCEADFNRGLFTDQKWINLVPVFFSGVHILRSDRFNVATWNLTNRHISLSPSGNYLVNNLPLGFYHFSGFDSGDLSVMAMKNGGHNLALKKLIFWYSSEVSSEKYAKKIKDRWTFNYFSDGSHISLEQRRVYKNRLDLQNAFPDPFDSYQYLEWWNSSHNLANQNPRNSITKLLNHLRAMKTKFIKVILHLYRGEFLLLIKKIYFRSYMTQAKLKRDFGYDLGRFSLNKTLQKSSQISIISVDIIVPIFNGESFVKKLLDSIIKNTNDLNYRLILVDDASTDENLSRYLVKFSSRNKNIVLLKNHKNLGFVGSVNEAYSYVNSDFFVILNSDTEVPPGWLSRLLDPLLKDSNVASSTPFSNAGTLNAFPYTNKDNQLFNGYSIDFVDAAFKSLPSLIKKISIPTGVGFCMAIRTSLTKKYGFLDPAYGRGYAEENDWCSRLSERGFKHILVENLFVYHKGSSSFSSKEKQELIYTNMKLLSSRYPLYQQKIAAHFECDPAAFIRDFVLLKLISGDQNKNGAILIIDHDLGGGANYYRSDEVKKFTDQKIPVLVFIEYGGKMTIKVFTQEKNFNFLIPSLEYLDFIFNQIEIGEVIYNNLVGAKNPLDIIAFILNLKKKYFFKLTYLLHDYFSICPSYQLLNHRGRFCEAPIDLKICQSCLPNQSTKYCNFVRPNENINSWRRIWESFLLNSDKVVVFSDDSRQILTKVYPLLNRDKVIVNPHVYSKSYLKAVDDSSMSNMINIGIIGGINYAKGGEVVSRLFELINKENLKNISLSIIGDTSFDRLKSSILVTGSYSRESLVTLVESLRINIFLMPSIWPETYSYVTDEMIAMNLPIVCFDVGAQADKISNYSKGLVLDLDTTTSDLLKQIQFHFELCSINMLNNTALALD